MDRTGTSSVACRLALAAVSFGSLGGVSAADWSLVQTVTSGTGRDYSLFGWAVACKGTTFAVSVPWGLDDYKGYVARYAVGTALPQALHYDRLTGRFGWFGASLAMDSNSLLIGAPGESDGGRASLQPATGLGTFSAGYLLPSGSTRSAGDQYGSSVAINGSVAVVGSPTDGDGSFAIYTSGICSRHTIEGSAVLGWAVAVNGSITNRLVAVSQLGDARTFPKVYVYSKRPGSAWALDRTLSAPSNGYFGQCLAISGTTLVVGCPGSTTSRGRAYVYDLSTSSTAPAADLRGSDDVDGADFGAAVAVSGDRIIVGAPQQPNGIYGCVGAVYVFEPYVASWRESKKLAPTASGHDQYFGQSVAIDGSASPPTIVVGAPMTDIGTHTACGAAYVYQYR